MIELNPGKHVCIVSTAHLSQQNPVYHVHEKLILVLVVERETGVILECDVNVVCNLTRQFIQKIYCGKNLMTEIDEIRCNVTRSVSKMTEIERRGGKRWDKPKKAEKSRDCGGGKF